MLEVFADRTYRHLFTAQVVALLGTGLATVALGLLAYDLAGDNAGLVLGTVFTIKMVAYVGIAPIAGGLREPGEPPGVFGCSGFLVRAGVALCLPFVTEVWQVYLLIFLLQSASAAFTPTFQATIPDVLPDEARYTRALSLSRLAYDSGEHRQPDAGRAPAGGGELQLPLPWNGGGVLQLPRCWSSRSCCLRRDRPSRAASTTARREASASTSRRRACAACWR